MTSQFKQYFIRLVNGRIVAAVELTTSREYTGRAEEVALLKMGFEFASFQNYLVAKAQLKKRA